MWRRGHHAVTGVTCLLALVSFGLSASSPSALKVVAICVGTSVGCPPIPLFCFCRLRAIVRTPVPHLFSSWLRAFPPSPRELLRRSYDGLPPPPAPLPLAVTRALAALAAECDAQLTVEQEAAAAAMAAMVATAASAPSSRRVSGADTADTAGGGDARAAVPAAVNRVAEGVPELIPGALSDAKRAVAVLLAMVHRQGGCEFSAAELTNAGTELRASPMPDDKTLIRGGARVSEGAVGTMLDEMVQAASFWLVGAPGGPGPLGVETFLRHCF